MHPCVLFDRLRRRGAAVAVLLLAGAAAQAAPAETKPAPVVRIATNIERSYFPPAEAMLRKAYASLDLAVEFVPLPLPRAHVELLAGHIDGAAMRAETYFEQTPLLRKVDVPLLELHVYAYGRPPCPTVLPATELGRYRISYQRGMVAVETLVPETARLPANTPSDAFINIGLDAADYALVLTTGWMAEVPVQTRHGTLCRVATPLSRTVLYHGVHKSLAARVAPLEQALRAMRARGEIEQAWAAYEREIALQNNRLQAEPGRSLKLTTTEPAPAPARPAP